MAYEPALAWPPDQVALPDPTWRPPDAWLTKRPRTVLFATTGVLVAAVGGVAAVHNLRYGIALVAGVALVVTVLLKPRFGGLILVAAVPALSGLKAGMPIPHVRVSEVLIGVIGATVLATARRRDAVAWQALDWVLLLYGIGWLAFDAGNSVLLHQHLSISNWGTSFGQLQFFLLYRGVRVALRTTSERRLAMRVLLGASVPVALLAVLQHLRVPGVGGFIIKITGGSQKGVAAEALKRATGPFDNWAALAGYLVPVLLVIAALLFAGLLRRRAKAAGVVAISALLGLFVTAELSAIVCVVIGVLVLTAQYGQLRRARRWVLPIVVVLAVAVGPFMATRLHDQFAQNATHRTAVPQTLAFRDAVWFNQYLPAIAKRPLTGDGLTLPPSIAWPFPESQYIAVLMEGGIPMLLLFGALMWSMVSQSRRIARSLDPYQVAIGRALTISTVALIAMDGVWPYISNGGLPQMLWCVFALVSPLAARAGQELGNPAQKSAEPISASNTPSGFLVRSGA